MPYSEKLECFFLETITHPSAAPFPSKGEALQTESPSGMGAGGPSGTLWRKAVGCPSFKWINARPAGDSSEWTQVRQGRRARRIALVEGRATIRRGLLRAMGSRGNHRHPIPVGRFPSRLSGANLPPGLLVLESRKRPGELRPFQNARHKPRFTRRPRCQEPVSGPRKNRWLTNVLA